MSVEKELLKTTSIKPQGGSEARQKFLLRMMMAVRKLSDDAWGELEAVDGAQDWYNAAVEADNEKQDLPDFPDAEPADAVEDDDDGDEDAVEDDDDGDEDAVEDDDDGDEDAVEDDGDEDAPKKKAAAPKKAPAKAAAKPAKKAAAKANGSAKAPPSTKGKPAARPAAAKASGKPSMRRMLKRIMVKKPKMTTEDLITELERKGYDSPSKLTVTSIRADTRDTIKVLNEAGLTSIDI